MLKAVAKAVLPLPVRQRVGARRKLRHHLKKAEPEVALLSSLCDPARMAIDVGASIGVYAHSLRTLARQVVAFEPHPEAYRNMVLATGAATSLGPEDLCALQIALSDIDQGNFRMLDPHF